MTNKNDLRIKRKKERKKEKTKKYRFTINDVEILQDPAIGAVNGEGDGGECNDKEGEVTT